MDSLPRPTKTYHNTTYDRIAKHHNFNGTGKTILITGGASGIGLAFSQAFAEAGAARIAIISRSLEQQERVKTDLQATHPSTQILTYQASVTDHSQIAKIIKDLGPIDVLILNAAIAHRRAQATDLTLQEIQSAFETNTIAPFTIAQAYLTTPPLPNRTKTIINIAAAAAHMINPYRAAYGSSKAAAIQIMQSLASQFTNDSNVRIFSFHPGSLYTPGVAANIPKNMMKWDDERLPAHFALWLAGEESGFLHGRYLWANWDVDELIGLRERVARERDFLTVGLVQ